MLEDKEERKNKNEQTLRKMGRMQAIFYSIPINKLNYKSDDEKKEGNPKAQKEKRK